MAKEQRTGRAQVKRPIGFIVEWTKTGFTAYSKDHPVVTTGETLQEVKRNIVEAMNLLLEDEGTPTHKAPAAKSIRVTTKDIALNMDMRHFFKKYSILNAKELAARIDMHQSLLSQYVSGTKMPSEEQTRKIIRGIRKVAKELSAVSLVARH